MKLTLEQQTIVNLNKDQHLVLAAPGTGKTELLVQRLSNAVKNGVPQKNMICLTFTNRAAKNMVDRIEKEIGEHEIFIGNIHSYCNSYLRKNKVIPQHSSLLDEEDVDLLFMELKAEIGDCYVIDKYSNTNRLIKTNELLNYNTYLNQKELGFDDSIIQNPKINFRTEIHTDKKPIKDKYSKSNGIKICTYYEQIKKESNFIDFDDLLTLTYFHLNQKIEASNEPIFKWLQIDEVQDLNPLQWAIVNKISPKKKSHRVFFGDYEQAIFSFMGAKLEVLDKVGEESTIHELQNNFRSPSYLLDLYNTYANFWLSPKWKKNPKSLNSMPQEKNSLSYKKVLIPHTKVDKYGQSSTTYSSTEDEEIQWIIDKKLPREPKENTAILVRINNTADKFANKFDEKGIDYFKISGFDLFKRKVIKDLMAFFTIIVNDLDRNAWIRNFHLYGKIKTLKESRYFINTMLMNGLKPLDFTSEKNYNETFLDDFLYSLQYQRIIVFDTETTGLDTDNDDIIQIAAIELINGQIGQIFEVYINTNKDLIESEKIHKISKIHLNKYSIDKRDALQQFLDFIGDDTLIAHNLDYDFKILNSNFRREGFESLSKKIKLYDSIEITKRLYPNLPSYKLEYLLEKLKISGKNSHNAVDDVKATVNLILSFIEKIENGKDKRIAFIKINTLILNNFSKRFSPIFKAVSGSFSKVMSLHDIADMIIGYMTDHLEYEIKENTYNEIDKLLKHMNAKCMLAEVLITINEYIPEYVKYKESDLVLGTEKIIIATVHKAKGLEFENVIIPGCTDDRYPFYYSKLDGEESILEDARLLYVAMTRTKKRLLITSHTKNNRDYPQNPSRFLEPIQKLISR